MDRTREPKDPKGHYFSTGYSPSLANGLGRPTKKQTKHSFVRCRSRQRQQQQHNPAKQERARHNNAQIAIQQGSNKRTKPKRLPPWEKNRLPKLPTRKCRMCNRWYCIPPWWLPLRNSLGGDVVKSVWPEDSSLVRCCTTPMEALPRLFPSRRFKKGETCNGVMWRRRKEQDMTTNVAKGKERWFLLAAWHEEDQTLLLFVFEKKRERKACLPRNT